EPRAPPPRSCGEGRLPAPRPGDRGMHRSLRAGLASGSSSLTEHDEEPGPERGDRDERQQVVDRCPIGGGLQGDHHPKLPFVSMPDPDAKVATAARATAP